MPIYYRNKSTGEIEGRFVGCDTNSSKFRNTSKYERFLDEAILDLEISPTPTPPPPWVNKLKNATTIKALRESLEEAFNIA